MPFAILGSLALCTVIYVALQIAFISALPECALANGWTNIGTTSAGGMGDHALAFGPLAALAAAGIPYLAFLSSSLIVFWSGWDVVWKLMVAVLFGLVLLVIHETGWGKHTPKLDVRAGFWMLPWLGGVALLMRLNQSTEGHDATRRGHSRRSEFTFKSYVDCARGFSIGR